MREYIRRANDWKIVFGFIVSLGAVVGLVAALFAYPMRWQRNCDTVDKIEPRVTLLEQNQASSRTDMAVIKAQYSDIHDQLSFLIRHRDH